MINFVLKYTGTYGLLAILALAIVTPSYFFFSNQQEKLSEDSKKQVINREERILEREASEKKTEENTDKSENDEDAGPTVHQPQYTPNSQLSSACRMAALSSRFAVGQPSWLRPA